MSDTIGMSEEEIEAQEKNKKERKHFESMSRLDLDVVMSSPNGRGMMWELLEDCSVLKDTFTLDPYDHAYRGGIKSVGLKWMGRILSECPEKYKTMCSEHTAKLEAFKEGL